MSQELFIPQGFGQLDPRFANVPVENELGEGIMGGYAVLAYPGKVWTVKHKGVETRLLVNPDDPTSDVVQSVAVVIVKSGLISKLFYKDGWHPGSTERPDCYSSNSIAPDAGAPEPQSHACALCPHDKFGSAPGTGKGKACSDGKRLAIVPLEDLANEFHNGPMLLRIPADSLQPLEEYGALLKKHGAPYYAIATRIRFDPSKEHQRLLMNPLRALTHDEVDIIMAHREDPRTVRVINAVSEVTPEGNAPEQSFYEQSEAQPAPPQQPPRRPAPPPGATPPPRAPQPAQRSPQNATAQAPRAPAATTPPAPPPRAAQGAPKPAQAPPTPASTQAPKPTGGFVAKAPATVATATQPSPVPQQRAAGGFARPANPPAPQPAPTTIAGAMAQPAARPATQRVVQQPPTIVQPAPIVEQVVAEEQQPEEQLDEYGNPAGTVYDEVEPENGSAEGYATDGGQALPDDLDEKLNALLGV